MRQVWITKKGGPEVLRVREAADPEPGPGELRVRVRAAGVNFADTMARLGLYPAAPKPPCVVGYEVSGVVDKAGPGAPAGRVGERCIALTRFGGYSDVVCVPADRALRFPERLSFAEAAALPVQWLTAWHMLVELGNLQKGQRVLVQAAAGGVGTAVLQIARRIGAEVIGTASPGKHEKLRALGITHAIDYANFDTTVLELTGGRGVDLALDAVGGSSFKRSYRALAPAGKLVMFGASSAAPGMKFQPLAALGMVASMPVFFPMQMLNANKGVFGVNMGTLWQEDALLNRELAAVLAGVEEGAFTPLVDLEVPFAEAPRAHQRLGERANFGKVVLVP